MAQFDIYRLANGTLAVDCQNDLLTQLRTRLVVPLAEATGEGNAIPRLHPVIEFDGLRWSVIADLATAVPVQHLHRRVGSAADYEYPIKRALDLLTSGI